MELLHGVEIFDEQCDGFSCMVCDCGHNPLSEELVINYSDKSFQVRNFDIPLPNIIKNSTYGLYDPSMADEITNYGKRILEETKSKVEEFLFFKELRDVLIKERNFNPNLYLHEKAKLINDFFRENNLDSCVLGISGGIDSAVVYKLLEFASQQENSPIKLIQPLFLPIYSNGITGQDEAKEYANLLVGEDKLVIRDLTNISKLYGEFYQNISPWTQGQIDSILRTPLLYGEAAYLQQNNYNSIVLGTTNLSECGYIGFYGKASDFCNDLQPISDIYKSEVYELAKLLNVPQAIIDRTPTGDVFDRSSDEKTIGAPYWFLELFTLFKYYVNSSNVDLVDKLLKIVTSGLSSEEKIIWSEYVSNINKIRNKNLHKYGVGNGAYHLNVMEQIIFKK